MAGGDTPQQEDPYNSTEHCNPHEPDSFYPTLSERTDPSLSAPTMSPCSPETWLRQGQPDSTAGSAVDTALVATSIRALLTPDGCMDQTRNGVSTWAPATRELWSSAPILTLA